MSKVETRAQQRDYFDKRESKLNELQTSYSNIKAILLKIPFVSIVAILAFVLLIIVALSAVFCFTNRKNPKVMITMNEIINEVATCRLSEKSKLV